MDQASSRRGLTLGEVWNRGGHRQIQPSKGEERLDTLTLDGIHLTHDLGLSTAVIGTTQCKKTGEAAWETEKDVEAGALP